MTRVLRLRGRVSAVAIATAVAVLAGSAAAAAADVPRPPGGTDGRGYELLNVPDKNQQQANSGALLSSDGNHALYAISGGTSASVTGVGAYLLATRTPSGWRSTVITPPLGEAIGDYYSMNSVTPDLSAYIATANTGGGSAIGTPTIVRLDASRNQTVLAALSKPSAFGQSGDIGASDGLEHVYAETDEKLDPDQVDGTFGVFDFASGTPVLISRFPDGTVPQCGAVPIGANSDGYISTGVNSTVRQHRISRDGRYTYFVSRGDRCGAPQELYGYDALSGRTELISGPVTSGLDIGTDRFLQADADGAWVAFTSETSYDAADTNGTLDVYRWMRGGGLTCMTCVVPNADISYVDGKYTNAVVSEDGSHVYFVSTDQLAGQGVAGERNLYVVRADGSLHYIGPVRGITYSPFDGGELTPDGDVFLFISNGTGLNPITGSDNGGNFAAYRYDDRDESLICVSCPARGPQRTNLIDQGLHDAAMVLFDRARVMTDDGSRLFFLSEDALVPQDVNESWDIYEWHDGDIGLITDGVTPNVFQATQPRIIGVSADGRDFLFRGFAPLTSEVQDQSENIYDARIGGGFAPPPSPPAPCAGDACQALPSGPPLLGPLGSSLLSDGDQLSETPKRRGHVRVSAVRSAARNGRAALSISVDMGGRVSVAARARIDGRLRHVGGAARGVAHAGKVQLRLRLSRAARAQLAQTGRLRLSVDVTFSRSSAPKHLTLVLKVPATANGR